MFDGESGNPDGALNRSGIRPLHQQKCRLWTAYHAADMKIIHILATIIVEISAIIKKKWRYLYEKIIFYCAGLGVASECHDAVWVFEGRDSKNGENGYASVLES